MVNPANIENGTYRNVNGNLATAWGFLAAAEKSGLGIIYWFLSYYSSHRYFTGTCQIEKIWGLKHFRQKMKLPELLRLLEQPLPAIWQ